jgi:hypothetical protein
MKKYILTEIKEDKKYKRLTINIPQEVHLKFKATCSLEGEIMSDVVLKMLASYVKDSNHL